MLSQQFPMIAVGYVPSPEVSCALLEGCWELLSSLLGESCTSAGEQDVHAVVWSCLRAVAQTGHGTHSFRFLLGAVSSKEKPFG